MPDMYGFMTGGCNSRPSLPRYDERWDLNVLLNLFKVLEPLSAITLKEQQLKVVMLLELTTNLGGLAQTRGLFDFVLQVPGQDYLAGTYCEIP